MNSRRTIADAISHLFPDGTVPRDGKHGSPPQLVEVNGRQLDIGEVPIWPPDAFAAAAYLLESTGVFQYLTPGGSSGRWRDSLSCIASSTHAAWLQAARYWYYGSVPTLAKDCWKTILTEAPSWALHYAPDLTKPLPAWLEATLGLLIMADEASAGAGYAMIDAPDSNGRLPWVASYTSLIEEELLDQFEEDSSAGAQAMTGLLTTLTVMANPDLVAVQPKSRTPQVGASFRTLSHNLAFLRPSNQIRTSWRRMAGQLMPESHHGLNILLIPFPYRIEPEWFRAFPEPSDPNGMAWGWFDIDQGWLPPPEKLADFVEGLVSQSRDPIHAVVFPEFSLTWQHHFAIVQRLSEKSEDFEFLVTGSNSNCEGDHGNYELTSTAYRVDGKVAIQSTSRSKHHRWRLDKSQIEMYGLGAQFDKNAFWWEGIHLGRRQLNTNTFRQGSSFSVLICEDLARSDPCHETLRSLGPNLVLCLLMDTAQIAVRWPARYAAGLAEDPGSSVLTFTSRALLERANQTIPATLRAAGKPVPELNWSVAMWRDGSGTIKELHCPPGQHGVVLHLKGESIIESTYDGRPNDDAYEWKFAGAYCVVGDSAGIASLEA